MPVPAAILQHLQKLTSVRLWLYSILASVISSEIIVVGLEWLLKGVITYDYLVTGFVTAFLVAAVIAAILTLLLSQIRLDKQLNQQLNDELFVRGQQARQAIAASNLALWDYDVTSGNVHLSEGWAQMLGGEYVPTATSMEQLSRLVPEEEQHRVRAAIVEALKGQSSSNYQVEHRVRKADGEYIWVQSEGAVTDRDPAGMALRMTGTNRDITQRKQAELDLLAAQAELTGVLNAIPDLLFELDLNGRYHKYYSQRTDLLAAPPDSLLGKLVTDVLPPQAAADCMAALQEANKLGYSSGRQMELVLEHGRKWFELSVSRKDGAQNEMPHFIVLSRDISARKQVEEELHESAEKLLGLFDLSPLGIALTDMDGHFIEFNKAFCNICGFRPEELRQLTYWDITPEEYRQQELKQLGELTDTGKYGPYEKHYLRKNGMLVPVQLTGMLLTGQDGKKHIWSIVEDISERSFMQEKLLASEKLYRDLVENAPDVIYNYSANNGGLYYSPQVQAILGYTPEYLCDRPFLWYDSIHPDDKEQVNQALHDYMRGGSYDLEYRIRTRTGAWKWLRDRSISHHKTTYDTVMTGIATDITLRKSAEVALRNNEANLRAILDNIPYLVWLKDSTGRFVAVNQLFFDTTGKKQLTEVLGRTDFDLWPKELAEKYVADDAEVMSSRKPKVIEEKSYDQAGKIQWVETFKTPVLDEDGSLLGTTGFARDITERYERLQALKLTFAVFESASEGIVVTSPENRIIMVNPAFAQITGYSAEEALGKNPSLLSSGKHAHEYFRKLWKDLDDIGKWEGEVWNRRKNGEVYAEWLSISKITDSKGKVSHYVAVFSDISKRKAFEDQLRFMAHHDVLTGLPNRILFMDRLQLALAQAKRNQGRLAVMFFDLDKFKPVNDSYGHGVGDMLLKEVALRLQACVRESDTVARIGGDEFCGLLPVIESEKDAVTVAEKVLHALRQPFQVSGHTVSIASSIGISIYPDDGGDAATLVKHADAAMYMAKDAGRDNVQFFQQHLRSPDKLA